MGIIVDGCKELNLFLSFCCELRILFIQISSVDLEKEFSIGQLEGQSGPLHFSFVYELYTRNTC
jgi:hypothetical protein